MLFFWVLFLLKIFEIYNLLDLNKNMFSKDIWIPVLLLLLYVIFILLLIILFDKDKKPLFDDIKLLLL